MEAQAWETLTPEEQESITQLTLRFSAALKQALEEEKKQTPTHRRTCHRNDSVGEDVECAREVLDGPGAFYSIFGKENPIP